MCDSGKLPVAVNYENPPDVSALETIKCPTGALDTFAGHRAKVTGEKERAS